MKKKKPMMFLIAAASFCIIISNTGIAGAASKHLKIGSIHPISGPISFLGVAFNRGYELAFDKVNKAGGIKIGDDNRCSLFCQQQSFSPAKPAAAPGYNCHFTFNTIH